MAIRQLLALLLLFCSQMIYAQYFLELAGGPADNGAGDLKGVSLQTRFGSRLKWWNLSAYVDFRLGQFSRAEFTESQLRGPGLLFVRDRYLENYPGPANAVEYTFVKGKDILPHTDFTQTMALSAGVARRNYLIKKVGLALNTGIGIGVERAYRSYIAASIPVTFGTTSTGDPAIVRITAPSIDGHISRVIVGDLSLTLTRGAWTFGPYLYTYWSSPHEIISYGLTVAVAPGRK